MAKILLADSQRRNAELSAKFSSCRLPPKEKFVASIKKVRDSATGPNGIPCSAYAACPDTSAEVLENTTELFGREADPGHAKADCYDFIILNRQLVWFAPKGEVDDDSVVSFVPLTTFARSLGAMRR